MYKTEQEKWKRKIIKKIKQNKAKWIKKNIVLFGISEATQIALDFIIKNGGSVKFIIDNNPIQQNHPWMGLQVYSPEYLKLFREDVYVIICGGLWYEKRQQLFENNIDSSNIFVIKYRKLFIQKIIDLIVAWKIVQNLQKTYGKHLLLCPYPGTGDAYLTGRYLPNYLKQKNLDKHYTILVTGTVFKKVLNMYGYSNIVVISQYECDKIKYLLSYFGNETLGVHYMLYWGLVHQTTYRIENYRNISFNELFEKTIFGIGEKDIFFPQYTEDKVRIQKLIIEYHIKENKTIILAPYANSFLDELFIEWWAELAKSLNKRGYKVFTNSSSDKEKVIPGTKKIFLSYQDMYPILEKCGYLIGIRSGLFDLMSNAKCKKIIIYQDFIPNERMNFFSLYNMQLCEDIVELKLNNSEKGRKELLQLILNQMENDC